LVGESLLAVQDYQELPKVIAKHALNELEADLVVLYEYVKDKQDVVIPPIIQGKLYPMKNLSSLGCWKEINPFMQPTLKRIGLRPDFLPNHGLRTFKAS
jgi:hypothetical protein